MEIKLLVRVKPKYTHWLHLCTLCSCNGTLSPLCRCSTSNQLGCRRRCTAHRTYTVSSCQFTHSSRIFEHFSNPSDFNSPFRSANLNDTCNTCLFLPSTYPFPAVSVAKPGPRAPHWLRLDRCCKKVISRPSHITFSFVYSRQKMKRSREPEEDLDPDSPSGASHPASPHPAKITGLDSAIDDSDGDESAPQPVTMRCSLPPHREPLAFQSYADYEAHYNSFHTNRCLECRKNFPSEHLLGVHIEEIHDPLVRIKRDRGEHTVRINIACHFSLTIHRLYTISNLITSFLALSRDANANA